MTRATLTPPVGSVMLLVWNAEMFVLPLAKEPGFGVGALANAWFFPPATEAIVRTVAS